MSTDPQTDSNAQKRSSVLKTLDRAAEIVSKWPNWKQDALGRLHVPLSSTSTSSSEKKTNR